MTEDGRTPIAELMMPQVQAWLPRMTYGDMEAKNIGFLGDLRLGTFPIHTLQGECIKNLISVTERRLANWLRSKELRKGLQFRSLNALCQYVIPSLQMFPLCVKGRKV